MTETTLSTALSTLVQVSATLAALIGFLGLWKLDQLNRTIAQTEMTLSTLIEQTGGAPILWSERLALAKTIASTPSSDLENRQRYVQTDIQKTLELWTISLRNARWVKVTLALFLLLAMAIFFLAFLGLVNFPNAPDTTSFRCYMLIAVGVLVVSTLFMIVLMAMS
jgi:hypothetical protein